MHKILGDNVFMFTIGAVLIPAIAVLLIGAHVLFADGPHVEQEINFLEVIAGGGSGLSGVMGAVHAWLAKGKDTSSPGA